MENKNHYRLKDQVVIVTGGCGLLGREYAHTFSNAGANVVIADIDKISARELANELTEKNGLNALGVGTDITNKDSVLSMTQKVNETFGHIDVLVNNAALDPKFDVHNEQKHQNSFEDFPLNLWNQYMNVNVTGMFLCSQAVAPSMLRQEKGVIINISSTYGLVGPDQRLYQDPDGRQTAYKPITYSVTKSAVIGLTRYLATYWAGKNIRVNTFSPGGVYSDHDEHFNEKYSFRTPMGRMANKSEYNEALLFLASDASSYMTGANLVIDGGWTAW